MGLFNNDNKNKGSFNLFRDANTGSDNRGNYYNPNNNAYNNEQGNSESDNSFFGKFFGGGGNNISRFSLAIILLVIIVFLVLGQGNPKCTGTAVSSVTRTKLETEFTEENGFYIDVPEGWTDETLKTHMLYYLQNTGVAPALYIMAVDTAEPAQENASEEAADSKYTREQLLEIAEKYYKEHFSDELHFLTVFAPYEDDYVSAYYVGEEAKAIMDAEALAIFEGSLNDNFFNHYTTDDMVFPNTYLSATNSIMNLFEEGSPVSKIIVIVIAAVLIELLFIRQNKRVKKYMQNETQEDQ